MVRLSNVKVQDKPSFIVEPIFVPDPSQTFMLERCPNPGYDDEVQVSVDTNGLLKAINVTTTSQAGAILVEATKLAVKLAGLAGGAEEKYFDISLDPDKIPTYSPELDKIQRLSKKEHDLKQDLEDAKTKLDTAEEKAQCASGTARCTYEADVKPANKKKEKKEKEYNDAMNDLAEAKASYIKIHGDIPKDQDLCDLYPGLGLDYISIEWLDPSVTNTAPQGPLHADGTNSIYYRPLKPCKIRVAYANNYFENIIYLPNKSPAIAIDITRPAFVKQVNKLAFTNGVLTEVYLNKPSEVLAGLKIPGDIINAIVGSALPLQVQVTLDKATTELLDAQGSQIVSLQQQLAEAQAKAQQAGK
jgi:hypothetical protein